MTEAYQQVPTGFVEQCCDMATGVHDYDPLAEPEEPVSTIDPRRDHTENLIPTGIKAGREDLER